MTSLMTSPNNITSLMTPVNNMTSPNNMTSLMTSAPEHDDITTTAMDFSTQDDLQSTTLPEDITTSSISTQCGSCVSPSEYYNNMMWWFTITGAVGLLTLVVGIIYFILWFFYMYEHEEWGCDCIHKKIGLTCPGEEGGRPPPTRYSGQGRSWSLLDSTDEPERKFQSTKIGRKAFSFT